MIKNRDLIILGIGFGGPQNRATLSKIIGVKGDTIYRHVRKMEKIGFIVKDEIDKSLVLSDEGMKRYEELTSKVYDYELLPELHSISKICKLQTIVPYINDPDILIQIIKSNLHGPVARHA